MQVSKEQMEPLLINHSEQINTMSDVKGTLRWIFTFLPEKEQSWTSTLFENVLTQLRSNDAFKETITPEILTVTSFDGGPQLEISGITNISAYCLSESPNVVPHIWKKRTVRLSEGLPNELPIRVVSHIIEEQSITSNDRVDSKWPVLSKHYRISKFFKYEHGIDTDDHIEYRIGLIRESPNTSESMTESAVSTQNIKYEFEIVFHSHSTIQNIMNTCISMVQLITQRVFPISKKQQQIILEGYNTLVRKILEKSHWNTDNVDNSATYHFLAPKPITLERINLIEPGPETYGINTVLKGYTVTDKADGERMLLYITKNGEAYIINNSFEIFETGLKTATTKLFNSLIDGEYILAKDRHSGKMKDLFAAFDIYFMDDKSIMNLPLIYRPNQETDSVTGTGKDKTISSKKSEEKLTHSRYDALKYISDMNFWDTKNASIDFISKQIIFAEASLMKDTCKELLSGARNLPYDIDGLIFTPAHLSVFGYYPGRPAVITENVKWDKVLKWKPKEQNTIDFLVEEGNSGVDIITKKTYKEFKLYTGYNSKQWEPITPLDGIRLRHDREFADRARNMKDTYKAKLFEPFTNYEKGVEIAHVYLNERNQPVCEDGSVIENKSIVEFAYNLDEKNKIIMKRWIPLRVREDKTRIFKQTGKLSKTANDLTVAQSVWRTIHLPVEREMITGITPVLEKDISLTLEERLLGIDNIYYARDIPRQHMLSVNMLDFHNQGIKKMLYERVPGSKRDSLLEIACGMAGDLPRWQAGGYRFIMGVDISRDNITNPVKGAYARMITQRRALKVIIDGIENTVYPRVIFLIGDCAKKFENGDAAGDDKESKDLFQMLYSNSSAANRLTPPYMREYIGKAARGFSLVSCMFAIHYFFETEDKLDGFFHNVAHNLKIGGNFITTFMDGDRVADLLSKSETGIAEGRKLNNVIPVWAIIKRYQQFEENNYYGKPVDVFLENINKMIPEYLVHFPTLVAKAKNYNLEVEDTGMFGETFNTVLGGINRSLPQAKFGHLEKAILSLENDEIQKQFSFLNRWVIFKKITS
jgi:hypothetical protein